MSNPAIDISELKKIMDNDMELIQDCFSIFTDDFPELYENIKKAVYEQNAKNLDKFSHKLKGSLIYLGAHSASEAALILESAGRKNRLDNIDKKLETLKNECSKVAEYINNFEF
jgi:HPt (histidine-containing phosphotransfer) domain-containing protein